MPPGVLTNVTTALSKLTVIKPPITAYINQLLQLTQNFGRYAGSLND